jgi:hypothetical protein
MITSPHTCAASRAHTGNGNFLKFARAVVIPIQYEWAGLVSLLNCCFRKTPEYWGNVLPVADSGPQPG